MLRLACCVSESSLHSTLSFGCTELSPETSLLQHSSNRWVAQLGVAFVVLSGSADHLAANLRIFEPPFGTLLPAEMGTSCDTN